MVENVRRSRAEWLAHVSNWQQSGLSQTAYSQRHGLKRTSFHKWVHAPSKTPTQKAAANLPLQAIPITLKEENASGAYVLRSPQGWELRLSSGVDASWLGRVLGVLS